MRQSSAILRSAALTKPTVDRVPSVVDLHVEGAMSRACSQDEQTVENSDENLEAPPGFEPGMEVLQTSALPLGDGAGRNAQGVPGVRPRDDTAINRVC